LHAPLAFCLHCGPNWFPCGGGAKFEVTPLAVNKYLRPGDNFYTMYTISRESHSVYDGEKNWMIG